MGTTDTGHGTRVSGLLVLNVGGKVGSQIRPISSGTLTGLAASNSDGAEACW